MTQAPATPELVERLKAMASMPFTRFHYADDAVMVKQAADALEAQQARIAELEVENERLRLTMLGGEDVAGFASSLPLAQVLDSFRTYETALRDSANSAQALADRYEKALRPFAEVAQRDIGEDEADADLFKPMSERNARAPLLKVGDLRRAAISIDDAAEENGQDGEPDEVLVDVAASLAAAISLLERGGRKASPSDKMFEHMLSDYRGSLSRARQALSSQGRREVATSDGSVA